MVSKVKDTSIVFIWFKITKVDNLRSGQTLCDK